LAVVVAGTSCGGPEPPDADREVPPVVMEDLPRQFRPHPRFDLTLGDLHGAIAGLASDQQSRILATPQRFLDLVAQALEEPEELLWLVDREHPLPADYIPPDLVSLTELYGDHLTLNRPDLSLRALVMPDLLAMAEAARREGVDLDLSSTYRSYRYQEWLFQYWVDEVGLERAERSSARPGTSQHQLGTAIDFGSITGPFAEHPAGRWLAAHAWRYGFSLSYPNGYEAITGYIFEPWHFRYISRPGTRLERLYFGGIQQFLLEFWEEQGALFRERYRPGGVPGASPDALPGGGDAPGSDG
jgi:zinc D-Ala-D-Ala carboxypeptidase